MIVINFEETFEPVSIEKELSQMIFNSPQVDGRNQEIFVIIDLHPDPYLPKVYNLGFGPPDGNGSLPVLYVSLKLKCKTNLFKYIFSIKQSIQQKIEQGNCP